LSVIKLFGTSDRMQELDHYRRIAHIDHGLCLMCSRRIKPGDEYEGYVLVDDQGLVVHKYHVFCPPDFWDDEEEQVRQLEESIEREEAARELSNAA